MARRNGNEMRFEKQYFGNMIDAFSKWEADDRDLEVLFEGTDYMGFPIRFANDTCVILDAGKYTLYIEWGINECPVYVDMLVSTAGVKHPTTPTYTRIGRVRNSRFWCLVERFKNHR